MSWTTFGRIADAELELARRFAALVSEHEWVWANNCWHPHPAEPARNMGEKHGEETNAVVAKIRRMERAAAKPIMALLNHL